MQYIWMSPVTQWSEGKEHTDKALKTHNPPQTCMSHDIHIWKSHVTFVSKSCHTCESAMFHNDMEVGRASAGKEHMVLSLLMLSPTPLKHTTHPTYEWVMPHTWVSHAAHVNETCHTVIGRERTHRQSPYNTQLTPNINESCHTREWVMTHMWMSHVTQWWSWGSHQQDKSTQTRPLKHTTPPSCHLLWRALCLLLLVIFFFFFFFFFYSFFFFFFFFFSFFFFFFFSFLNPTQLPFFVDGIMSLITSHFFFFYFFFSFLSFEKYCPTQLPPSVVKFVCVITGTQRYPRKTLN